MTCLIHRASLSDSTYLVEHVYVYKYIYMYTEMSDEHDPWHASIISQKRQMTIIIQRAPLFDSTYLIEYVYEYT